MAKLYPPTIDNCTFSGNSISIPLEHNPAVSIRGLDYRLKITQVNTGTLVEEVDNGAYADGLVTFGSLAKNYNEGQYYKIQIAYVSNNIVGYYSTVKLAYYTASYILETSLNLIQGSLSFSIANLMANDQPISYQVDVYESNNLLESTGEKPLENGQAEITDLFNGFCWQNIEYNIKTTITTANGVVVSANNSYTPTVGTYISLSPINNFDLGYIEISTPQGNDSYYLSRYSNINGVEKLYRLAGLGNNVTYKDRDIEQGVEYIYILRSSSDGYGLKTNDDPIILSDYEDMFLYDNDKQLRLRYNPQISSYKTIRQESKVETIGNKYPRFFRNGAIAYKEFPVSGMLARELDEEGFFWSEAINEPDRTETSVSSQIEDRNGAHEYMAERVFKNNVLDWLNNGKPKIFKSPQEGLFVVMISGVSLSPIDTLGRRFHNVSMTATEIAEATPGNIPNYIGSYVVNSYEHASNDTYGIVKGEADGVSIYDGKVNSINIKKLVIENDDSLVIGEVIEEAPPSGPSLTSAVRATNSQYGIIKGSEDNASINDGIINNINVNSLYSDGIELSLDGGEAE